jgi:DNA polymerase sigma
MAQPLGRPLIMLVKAWAKARGINSAPQVVPVSDTM